MGVDYAYTIAHKAPQRTSKSPRGVVARGGVIRPTREADLRVCLLSLGAGLLVGLIYSLLGVRSPALPVVALVGLLGILIADQIIPVAKHMLDGSHLAAAWAPIARRCAHLRPPAWAPRARIAKQKAIGGT
jgi:XapX domain-containing protein